MRNPEFRNGTYYWERCKVNFFLNMNAQEFVENAPLYNKVAIRDFWPPNSITRACIECGKETTWALAGEPAVVTVDTSPRINFKTVGYSCVLCTRNSMAVVYELLEWREETSRSEMPIRWHHYAVRKIGQIPPQEIDIPVELNKRLGTTASHYRKALICRSQNYGIGAMAYLRRVVDEKTDELIDVMVELARTYNVDDETIGSLLAAKKEVRYEDKMKVAAELIPGTLKPGDVNPLGQLYKQASIGLHGKSDDECIAIFDDLRADFEFVFRNLHFQAQERRDFAKRVQSRAGRASE